jgi:hypothetical protein
LLVELACAGTLAPQTFIHVADPQFGMLTKNASFEHKGGEPGVRHREREPAEASTSWAIHARGEAKRYQLISVGVFGEG